MRSQVSTSNELIGYNIATSSRLPPPSGKIKEYWLGGNGVFARTARKEIDVCVQLCKVNILGLPAIEPYFTFALPLVPQELVAQMLKLSQNNGAKEILFYLSFNERWQLFVPQQLRSDRSVTPILVDRSSYNTAIIEVHSHHSMKAIFSPVDDKEESGKFRLFAVLGEIFTRPAINVRLGIYDLFCPVAASKIFELPPNLIDANRFIL